MTNLDISKYPATKWITSDPDGYWHLGKRNERRGSKTGNLHAVYYLTACSGRQLGGPFGQTERDELPPNSGVCPRCAAIAKKQQQQPAAPAPAPAVEKPYDPTKSTERFEALVLEHKCGNTKMGEEVVLADGGQAFARMIHDTPEARTLALSIVTQLNDSIEHGARPSRQQLRAIRARWDDQEKRDREHVEKTITLNFGTCEQQMGWLKNLVQVNGPTSKRALSTAAEMYGCRTFVRGVIEGRLHYINEADRTSIINRWEDQWDTAFGDLVGKTLGMQE